MPRPIACNNITYDDWLACGDKIVSVSIPQPAGSGRNAETPNQPGRTARLASPVRNVVGRKTYIYNTWGTQVLRPAASGGNGHCWCNTRLYPACIARPSRAVKMAAAATAPGIAAAPPVGAGAPPPARLGASPLDTTVTRLVVRLCWRLTQTSSSCRQTLRW